jgi:hypothetical protein
MSMSRTEKDAAEKWCPFSRVFINGNAGINRFNNEHTPAGAECIGSACMAWTWTDHPGGSPPRGRCGLVP